MNDFTFHNPTRIHFGKDQWEQLPREIPEGSKVLLLFGGGSIKKNGVYDKICQALKNYELIEFSGIEPNPTYETLMQAVELARKESVDFLLAAGGGSVIDGTKFISVAIPYKGDPWELVAERADSQGQKVPFGAVLTLPATGSEMNKASVVTKASEQDKRGFMHPDLYPQFSLLDPTTTFSLPKTQIANGVIDAFVHVTEQYLTYPSQAPLQDRFAESLLSTLIEEGPKALAMPEDYPVRANIMWCATMALNGVIGSGVPQDWATHMLGHELTAEFNIAHGTTLAIILPSTLRHMREHKREKLLQYAERVWGIQEGSPNERVDEAIDKTQGFFEAMGVRTHMKHYGITDKDIETFLQRLETKGFTAMGEHQNIDLERSRQIYLGAM